MDWKLTMAISSSACKSLNSPSVTLLLHVMDSNGDVSKKAVEMTVSQFQVCWFISTLLNFEKHFETF